MTGKKFVSSYSGGKDSMLSVYLAIEAGLVPLSFITTYNTDKKRSWFHGIPEPLLAKVSQSLELPIHLIRTSGAEYQQNFELALAAEKEKGAEVCVFGDIDIEGHFEWCTQRCKAVGLEAFFPLKQWDRKDVVFRMIDAGFVANINIVDTSRMNSRFLGKVLTRDLALEIEADGADICGENGEYHSFVSDGPIFKNPIDFKFGEQINEKTFAILPLLD